MSFPSRSRRAPRLVTHTHSAGFTRHDVAAPLAHRVTAEDFRETIRADVAARSHHSAADFAFRRFDANRDHHHLPPEDFPSALLAIAPARKVNRRLQFLTALRARECHVTPLTALERQDCVLAFLHRSPPRGSRPAGSSSLGFGGRAAGSGAGDKEARLESEASRLMLPLTSRRGTPIHEAPQLLRQ